MSRWCRAQGRPVEFNGCPRCIRQQEEGTGLCIDGRGHRTKPIPIPSSVAVQCIQSFAYVVHYQHACSSIPIINIGDHLGPLRTRPSSLALPPPVTQQYATFRPRIALWSLRQMRGAGWWRAGQRRKCLEGQEGSRVARGARTLSIQPAVAFVWAG